MSISPTIDWPDTMPDEPTPAPVEPTPADLAAAFASPAEIRGQILNILTGRATAYEKRRAICALVLEALKAKGALYHHAELRDFDSAMFFNGDLHRLEKLRGDGFQSWLSAWLGINRADNLFDHVQAAIETAALDNGTAILPEAFWASRPGAVYLSNGPGNVVKITGDGVALVANGTDGVLFPAAKALPPWRLVEPQDPFITCGLFRDISCAAAHGPDLLRLWVYSWPTNPRCKPPAVFSGGVGSGKTKTIEGAARLFGLPHVACKVEEDKEGDFWPCCDQGGVFTLDNADTRTKWLADAIANAATGGGKQGRRLYTNGETVTLRARAWIAITTANPTFANDAGLADRLLVIRMNRREGFTSDAALLEEIDAHRDAALSHIADVLRAALADTGPTPAGLNSRHPDFAAFAVRIGRALGREDETVTALRAAESDKSFYCLENDPVTAALLARLESNNEVHGTAAEIKTALAEVDSEIENYSPKRIAKRLINLWPHLESVCHARRELNRSKNVVFSFAKKPACGICGI